MRSTGAGSRPIPGRCSGRSPPSQSAPLAAAPSPCAQRYPSASPLTIHHHSAPVSPSRDEGQSVQLVADYSHFLAACEADPGEAPMDDAIDALHERVRHVHARVGFANGPQVSAREKAKTLRLCALLHRSSPASFLHSQARGAWSVSRIFFPSRLATRGTRCGERTRRRTSSGGSWCGRTSGGEGARRMKACKQGGASAALSLLARAPSADAAASLLFLVRGAGSQR